VTFSFDLTRTAHAPKISGTLPVKTLLADFPNGMNDFGLVVAQIALDVETRYIASVHKSP